MQWNTHLVFLLKNITDLTPNGTGNMINVLRLDGGLHGVLQNFGEVILKLRPTKVNQNLLPIGWRIVLAEVGLHLAGENFERGALANSIGSDETKDLTGAGHGKTVELEGVGTVPVGSILLEVLWEVDNGNRLKGTFLHADAASCDVVQI